LLPIFNSIRPVDPPAPDGAGNRRNLDTRRLAMEEQR